ncbi:MAG TPA: NPCBM/NEW2 domain-containing protein [Trebonia sp.]
MIHRRRRHMLPVLIAVVLCAGTALAAASAPRTSASPPPTTAAAPAASDVSAVTTADGPAAGQSYNGTALTPPMGWNDWYQYRCTVTEDDVLANARALVSSGLAALGYDYVNLDDCWMASTRDASGNLQADPARFPHGIAWLADQLHAMGLKLGVYEGAGTTTCQGLPGSWGYYQQDAGTFASWGVDYVKFDYCGKFPHGNTTADLEADYKQMSQDLVATGRPIVYSEELPIAAGDANPANASYLTDVAYSAQIANLWRVAPDETTDFDSTVFGHLTDDLPLAQYAHPGAWNDLDMLLTGTDGYGWTAQQEQTQMSIWAEMASPLIVSADLTSMSAATRQILGNKAVVAVDQDPLGKQAQLVAQQTGVDVVSKPLANGDVAVLLANTGSTAQQVSTTAATAGLGRAAAYSVSDLWAGTTRESAGTITATVPAEGSVLLRVSPLRGSSVGTYAPYTNLDVSADVPAAYSGSQFDVAQPGQTISVQASLRNEGREPLRRATLSLTGPSGWHTGPPGPDSILPTGRQFGGQWQVTVPPGTAAGTYTLTATARYLWGTGHRSDDSARTTVQVVVPPTGTPTLDQLSWLSAVNGFDAIGINENHYGGPLSIHGTVYPHGLWVNSVATIYYYLGGNCTTFTADLGLDDSDKGTGAVDYEFYADGAKVYDSGVVTNSTPTIRASANVSGAKILELYVGEGNGTISYGNADFGSPQLTCAG